MVAFEHSSGAAKMGVPLKPCVLAFELALDRLKSKISRVQLQSATPAV